MPETRASSIARPDTPSGSLATLASSGPGILQHLVQPLSLPGALGQHRLAVAGQIPSSRIGLGGTNQGRTSPCSTS